MTEPLGYHEKSGCQGVVQGSTLKWAGSNSNFQSHPLRTQGQGLAGRYILPEKIDLNTFQFGSRDSGSCYIPVDALAIGAAFWDLYPGLPQIATPFTFRRLHGSMISLSTFKWDQSRPKVIEKDCFTWPGSPLEKRGWVQGGEEDHSNNAMLRRED